MDSNCFKNEMASCTVRIGPVIQHLCTKGGKCPLIACRNSLSSIWGCNHLAITANFNKRFDMLPVSCWFYRPWYVAHVALTWHSLPQNWRRKASWNSLQLVITPELAITHDLAMVPFRDRVAIASRCCGGVDFSSKCSSSNFKWSAALFSDSFTKMGRTNVKYWMGAIMHYLTSVLTYICSSHTSHITLTTYRRHLVHTHGHALRC